MISKTTLDTFETFKSPASTLLGTRLIAFDETARTTRMSFDVRPEFLNILGGVHGGLVAAMLDEAAGMGARLSLPPDLVLPSLDFRVSFLAPAPAETLFAETRCLRQGRRIAFLEADLLDKADRLLARMNVTSIVVESSRAAS